MSDNVLPLYFEVLTDVSAPELDEIKQALRDGSINPRDLKMRLAAQIVTQFHSIADAQAAEAAFVRQFQNREIPEDISVHALSTSANIVDLMVETGLAQSKSEARRLIDGGGVRLNGQKIEGYEQMLEPGASAIVQVGRRKFVQIQ
jgi:tyrosyl-tRNA synthetase